MTRYTRQLFIQLVFLLGLTACHITPLSYYDATSYSQLTSLKAETMTLLETFDVLPYRENEARIAQTRLNLRKAFEYEKGKGEINADTRDQLSKIIALFASDVQDYQQNGPGALGKKYFQQAAVLMGQAFDIVIATESLKNPNQRQE